MPVTSESTAIGPGLRVLLVEDEMVVAMMLEEMLKSLGCITLKAARVEKALQLAAAAEIDVALLDVNVAGVAVYPVAEVLDRRRIPFVFSTGYLERGLREDYRDRPILSKPYSVAALEQVLINISSQNLERR